MIANKEEGCSRHYLVCQANIALLNLVSKSKRLFSHNIKKSWQRDKHIFVYFFIWLLFSRQNTKGQRQWASKIILFFYIFPQGWEHWWGACLTYAETRCCRRSFGYHRFFLKYVTLICVHHYDRVRPKHSMMLKSASSSLKMKSSTMCSRHIRDGLFSR